METIRGKKIFVGLSGGVDSAVSAALLQEAGANVVGVFIKGWYPEGLPCTWAEDRRDAMRVAAHLKIPFVTLDASTTYKKSVLEYLIREYQAGRTPNPDVMCNRDVKFGVFHIFAKEKGADAIATGHYAKTHDGRLFRGEDEGKDQSYFLWAVPALVLKTVLFPLGAQKKSNVRTLAKKFTLPVADKKDSQGICFLGPVSVDEFLAHELSIEPGHAYDEAGNEIGLHKSALLYTLGERIALFSAPSGPWYVLKKDLSKNELTVSKKRSLIEETSTISIAETNWFNDVLPHTLTAQYRYHGPKIDGTFNKTSGIFTTSTSPPEPIAAGQSLVLYHDNECMGGGIIE